MPLAHDKKTIHIYKYTMKMEIFAILYSQKQQKAVTLR